MLNRIARGAALLCLVGITSAAAQGADRPATRPATRKTAPAGGTRKSPNAAKRNATEGTPTATERAAPKRTPRVAPAAASATEARYARPVAKRRPATSDGRLTSAVTRARTSNRRQNEAAEMPEGMSEENLPDEPPHHAPSPPPIPSHDYEPMHEAEMCYEDGCVDDSCCDILCEPACYSRFYAGFDFLFLQANFEDNPGMLSTRTNANTFQQTTSNFNYDPKLSPRVYFGFTSGCGLGLRTRYFQFEHNAQNINGTATFDTALQSPFAPEGVRIPSTTAAGDTFQASSGLEIKNLDLEGTKSTSFGSWSFITSAGLRYGLMRQKYQSEIRDANGGRDATAQYAHRFEGFGPTISIEARRIVGPSLTFFSAARTSIVWGHGSAALTAFDGLQNTVPNLTMTYSRRNDLLPSVELQLGCEYVPPLALGRAQLYCRGAFEAQWYSGAGNATSEEGDLALVGGLFSVGLRY